MRADKIVLVGFLSACVLMGFIVLDNQFNFTTPNREVHGSSNGSDRHTNAVAAYGLHDVVLGSREFIRCGLGTDSYEFTAKNISEAPVHGIVCCGLTETFSTCKVKY